MGIVKARKIRARSKIVLFSKTVQDCRNRSADICLVMQADGQAYSLCDSYNLYAPHYNDLPN